MTAPYNRINIIEDTPEGVSSQCVDKRIFSKNNVGADIMSAQR